MKESDIHYSVMILKSVSLGYHFNKNALLHKSYFSVFAYDLFSSNYEYVLLMGDFNAGLDNAVLKDFCNLHNLTNLINKAAYCKNPNNPS